MLQIAWESYLKVHKLEQVMKRLGKLLSIVSVMSFVVLGTAGLAEAQRRNERQVRDLVRTLNAQIDDFQYGLDHQLRSTSTASRIVDDAHESIRNLQSRVDDFDENKDLIYSRTLSSKSTCSSTNIP